MWEFLIGYLIGQSSRSNSNMSAKDARQSYLMVFGIFILVGGAMVLPVMISDGIGIAGFPIWLFKLVVFMFAIAAIGAAIEVANFDRALGVKKLKFAVICLASGMISLGAIGMLHSMDIPLNLPVSNNPVGNLTRGLTDLVMTIPFLSVPLSAICAVVYCLYRPQNNSVR